MRAWFLGVVSALVWAVAFFGLSDRAPLGPDAPATQFSAARAQQVLARLLGPERPHPAGSAENAALHVRLRAELARLGLAPQSRTHMSCLAERLGGTIACGTVTNILAHVPGRSGAKDVVLVAHMDSVPAGPGAGDDQSGVATILESLRALKARGLPARNGITALFTDGEEFGLLGAAAYLREPDQRARVGAAINVEARGNQGPSYLFQTSAGDGPLIALYARSVPRPRASSLYAEIYRHLPNDTDLTAFLDAGLAGYNFGIVGDVAQYHTPLDRRENFAPATLQSHGDNVLGLADALARADPSGLRGSDAIYFDLFGLALVRAPAFLALPLAIGAFLMIALVGWLAPRPQTPSVGPFLAAAMPPLLLMGAVAAGFALHGIAAVLSGHADPSFAHPACLRLALALAVWAIALLAARRAGSITPWLWLSLLGIGTAAFLPGASPFFIFPSLVAGVLLLLTIGGGRRLALVVAGLGGVLVWLSLAAGAEAVAGLKAHPLFTVPVAFALTGLLPLLKGAKGARLSLGAALIAAVVAGLLPAYSARQPQRLNLRYVEEDGRALWLADPVDRLPTSLRRAAPFSQEPQWLGPWGLAYVAPAGPARTPAPSASAVRAGARVRLALHGSPAARAMTLTVPAAARLTDFSIGGVTMKVPAGPVTIICATPDCAQARLSLTFAAQKPVTLRLAEMRYGLPPQGAGLLRARPATAVPSQFGDVTWLVRDVALPRD